jgi:hypothetical protein
VDECKPDAATASAASTLKAEDLVCISPGRLPSWRGAAGGQVGAVISQLMQQLLDFIVSTSLSFQNHPTSDVTSGIERQILPPKVHACFEASEGPREEWLSELLLMAAAANVLCLPSKPRVKIRTNVPATEAAEENGDISPSPVVEVDSVAIAPSPSLNSQVVSATETPQGINHFRSLPPTFVKRAIRKREALVTTLLDSLRRRMHALPAIVATAVASTMGLETDEEPDATASPDVGFGPDLLEALGHSEEAITEATVAPSNSKASFAYVELESLGDSSSSLSLGADNTETTAQDSSNVQLEGTRIRSQFVIFMTLCRRIYCC